MKDNNKMNYTNVTLNSTSSSIKAEPYPFSASAEFQDLNKGIRKREHGNKFLKPVRNDMKEKILNQVQDDNTAVVQNNIKEKTYNGLINFKKVAFTLAEVLITLGIVGIVAAMTIPTLITNNQKKQTVVKLQRAISVLNQAYKLSYDDVGELGAEETKDFNSLEYFNTYWAPYIKVSTYCRSAAQCGYKSDKPWKYADWSKSTLYPVEPRLRTAFITADGFLYTIYLATWNIEGESKNAWYKVTVDLNGSEGPNRYGRDVFFLSGTQTDGGGIRPYCYEKSNEEVDNDCSKQGVGECCAEKIRRAGWEINRDYPWK